MHKEKVIWEEPSIPSFPMVRGETYFTRRDLEEIRKRAIPHPKGIADINDLVEMSILFETFCKLLEGSNKDLIKALARSSVSPFNPLPLQVTSAMFENPGYFIPYKFHSLLLRVWLYQLGHFVRDLYGENNK